MKTDTREKCAKAFLSLLDKKDIDDITVTEISQVSGVSRESFYYHFKDKYDLIYAIYTHQGAAILDQYFGKEPWIDTVIRTLKIIKKRKNFYKRGFEDQHYHNLERAMHETSIAHFKKQAAKRDEIINDEIFFLFQFVVFGIVGTMKQWVTDGMKIPEEKLAAAIVSAFPEKLNQYMRNFN